MNATSVIRTPEFREAIIRIDTRLEEGFRRMDQRFDTVDQRFEAVDRRFEAVDKRFETIAALHGYTIRESAEHDGQALSDDVNLRFEDVNRRCIR